MALANVQKQPQMTKNGSHVIIWQGVQNMTGGKHKI